jgi:hypothetical protein
LEIQSSAATPQRGDRFLCNQEKAIGRGANFRMIHCGKTRPRIAIASVENAIRATPNALEAKKKAAELFGGSR